MFKHFTGITYTNGIQNLAETKNAYWLIDAIASHVKANPKFSERCKQDQRFADMQIWILSQEETGAKLIAVADTDEIELNNPACEQNIPFTDFEFAGQNAKFYCAKNWVENKEVYTLLMPNEY